MITTVVITTKDRDELVQRAVSSFREANASRDLSFVVYDQSEVTPSYTGIDRFCGPPEVAAYIDKLAQTGLPRDLLEFALVGGHGGYRNVAMLDTVGQHVLATDDDTICEFVASPDVEEGLHYGQPKFNYLKFKNRQEWVDMARNLYKTKNVIGEHERLVGQGTQDGYTFRVVAAGLLGDSAASFNHNSLFDPPDKENYRAIVDTREVMQVVPVTTVTIGSPFLRTMNYSFDNTKYLPPFPPNGRGEPGVFASVLALMKTELIAYLPWAVVHTPPEGRPYQEAFGPLGFDEAFYTVQSASSAKTIETLGRALSKLKDVPIKSVIALFCEGREQAALKYIQHLHECMAKYGSHKEWLSDAEKMLARAKTPLVISEEEATHFQKQVSMYGDLLLAWPDIYDTAVDLGERISK